MSGEHQPETNVASSSPPSIIISEGAAIALGNALSRFISIPSSGTKKPIVKRPRLSTTGTEPIVLVENDDVRQELNEKEEFKKKYKLQRQRKLKFESNAHVIPDVTTNLQIERTLLETATKGTVALFNAVTKAQRINAKQKNDKKKLIQQAKKEKSMVNKQSFMNLMKAGIQKSNAKALPLNIDKNQDDTKEEEEKQEKKSDSDSDGDSADSDGEDNGTDQLLHNSGPKGSEGKIKTASKAKWLSDDYLTSGSANAKIGSMTVNHGAADLLGGSSDEESDEEDMDMEDDGDDEMEDDDDDDEEDSDFSE